MQKKVIRWGIIGTGKIANRFAAALSRLPGAKLMAVGSRDSGRGAAFAAKHGIPKCHEGYAALAADPEVDIVYIGSPHVFHLRDASVCIAAGKHVLCEKVFTINAREAEELIRLARSRKRFLMEAMWTRFFPAHVRIRELIREGRIGDILAMQINFLYPWKMDPENRRFKPALGGGALMDAGSYCVSFVHSLLGAPDQIKSLARMGETGVDIVSACLFGYSSGPIAMIAAGMVCPDVKNAIIVGTKGRIDIHDPWYKPTAITLHIMGQEPEHMDFPLNGKDGYEYEAEAVMNCIREGKTECEVMSLDETFAIMKTLDAVRAQWNLTYPSEARGSSGCRSTGSNGFGKAT